MPNHYDKFYGNKKLAWVYNIEDAKRYMTNLMIKPLGIKPGAKILEIGCGQGYHSEALHQLGFNVVGNDISPVAESTSAQLFAPRGWPFICQDTDTLIDTINDRFDVILCRGHSWYHYGLRDDKIIDRTKRLFNLLNPGGIFILQIKTDFSGKSIPGGVVGNKYQDYIDLFSPMGSIERITNWSGVILNDEETALTVKGNIIIATRKPLTPVED